MGNTYKIKSDMIGSNLVQAGKFIDINAIQSSDVLNMNVNKICSYDAPTKTTQTVSVSQPKSDC